jgi:hypothetical protein
MIEPNTMQSAGTSSSGEPQGGRAASDINRRGEDQAEIMQDHLLY